MKTIFSFPYFFSFFVAGLVFINAMQSQTLQGSITISADDLAKINQVAANPAKPNAHKIVAQLWQVRYAPEKNDAQTTDIFLVQKQTAKVSYKTTATGINYSIADAAAGNNLAVVVYAAIPAAETSLKIKGKPSDGQHVGRLYRYKSDAPQHLKHFGTENIIFGVYSIIGSQTDITHLDFNIGVQGNKSNCKTCFGFDDIGDIVSGIFGDGGKKVGNAVTGILHGIEHTFDKTLKDITGNVIPDLANCVVQDFNGLGDATNFFINQTGQYFYMTSAGLVNLVQHGDLPKVRDIGDDEFRWANDKLFHGALQQSDKIKIFNFSKLDNQSHGFFTWPGVNQYIYMNLGDDGGFEHPMTYTSGSYTVPGQVFIHELAHVWQIQHYGRQAMVTRFFNSGGNSPASYIPDCSKGLNGSFPIESEAAMIDGTYGHIYSADGINPHWTCLQFQQKWVENNVLGGRSLDALTIEVVMRQHAQIYQSFIGGIPAGQLPTYSNGNGGGYFMLGNTPWSVLYYPIKYKKAYANWGEIRKKYNTLNAERGVLGWPQTDIGNLRDNGSFQRFEKGFIHSSSHGTFYMDITPIINTYGSNNWEKGKLGYPISDFIPDNLKQGTSLNFGGIQNFEHGIIRLTRQRGPNGAVIENAVAEFNNDKKSSGTTLKNKIQTDINPQPLPPKKKN